MYRLHVYIYTYKPVLLSHYYYHYYHYYYALSLYHINVFALFIIYYFSEYDDDYGKSYSSIAKDGVAGAFSAVLGLSKIELMGLGVLGVSIISFIVWCVLNVCRKREWESNDSDKGLALGR